MFKADFDRASSPCPNEGLDSRFIYVAWFGYYRSIFYSLLLPVTLLLLSRLQAYFIYGGGEYIILRTEGKLKGRFDVLV